MPHKGHIGTSMNVTRIPKSKRVVQKPCLKCGKLGDTKQMVVQSSWNGDKVYYHKDHQP